MYIHPVKAGESIFRIARNSGVPATLLIAINGLTTPDRLSPGEEILILTPTRTHTLRGGETLSTIATRYGIRKRDLLAGNPGLSGADGYGERIYPGQIIAIRYDAPTLGSGAAIGYITEKCSADRLAQALPILTYAVFVSATLTADGRVRSLFSDREQRDAARRAGVTLLVKICAGDCAHPPKEQKRREDFIAGVISYAKAGGYHGILLDAPAESTGGAAALLLALRRAMLGCDLLLFLDVMPGTSPEITDLADGVILHYDKLRMSPIPSLREGEERVYRTYAEENESFRTFLSLPTLSQSEKGEMTEEETRALAVRHGKCFVTDEETGVCGFRYRVYRGDESREVTVRRYALHGIRARMRLAAEYGYGGIAADLADCPTAWLSMFSALFARNAASMPDVR